MANLNDPIWDREQSHVDDGGSVGDDNFVKSQIEADFASLGQVVTDIGDIPVGGDTRANGIFTDPADAEQWLSEGGLTFYDQDGSNLPLPWVWLIHTVDQFGEDVYQVFISDDSNVT